MSSKSKATLTQLRIIQYALRVVLLPVKGTGLNYKITKNLVKVDAVIRLKDEELKILNSKFTNKDTDGNPIQYAYKSKDGMDVYSLDTDGNFIIVDKEKDKITPTTIMRDSTNPEYIKAMEELNNDVEIEFHRFDNKEVVKLFEDGTFDGLDLTPLVGFLFDLEE